VRMLVALALGTALAAPGRAGEAAPSMVEPAPAAPSLTGKWTLNKEQSEDARAQMRDAGGGRRPGGWSPGAGGGMRGGGRGDGFGGRGGGAGGPGGGFGGRGGGERDADGRSRGGPMRSFFEPPETLTITQSAEEIGVDDGQRVLHLHPDGKKIKSEGGGGGAETTTKWRGNELVVESKSERGPRITSAYMAVPEKRQLYITSTMAGRSGEPITVRRVYDAAE
jgi:hypothetical protein